MENFQTGVKENDNDHSFTEGILYDVLDKIFQYLSIKDLCRAAAVCKSWHHIVSIEISKRNDIESLILPINDESYDDGSDDDNEFKYLQHKWHFSNSLRSLPEYLLLFHDDTVGIRRDNENYSLYYRRHLKEGTGYGCFETIGLSLNTKEVRTVDNEGIGITLPSTTKLKVNYYVPWETEIGDLANTSEMARNVDKALDSLISNEDEHNCFIFLRNRAEDDELTLQDQVVLDNDSFLHEFSRSLKQRCTPGSYTLWGGAATELTCSSYGRNDLIWLTIIRISGLALRSWSIVLKMNLSDTEVESRLTNMKKNINLKSNSVALAMIQSNKNESLQQRLKKTEVFRKIFSNIPLVGVATNFAQIGVNSMESDPDPVIEHKNSIAYLILSTE